MPRDTLKCLSNADSVTEENTNNTITILFCTIVINYLV